MVLKYRRRTSLVSKDGGGRGSTIEHFSWPRRGPSCCQIPTTLDLARRRRKPYHVPSNRKAISASRRSTAPPRRCTNGLTIAGMSRPLPSHPRFHPCYPLSPPLLLPGVSWPSSIVSVIAARARHVTKTLWNWRFLRVIVGGRRRGEDRTGGDDDETNCAWTPPPRRKRSSRRRPGWDSSSAGAPRKRTTRPPHRRHNSGPWRGSRRDWVKESAGASLDFRLLPSKEYK